jgi:hypothetical protein
MSEGTAALAAALAPSPETPAVTLEKRIRKLVRETVEGFIAAQEAGGAEAAALSQMRKEGAALIRDEPAKFVCRVEEERRSAAVEAAKRVEEKRAAGGVRPNKENERLARREKNLKRLLAGLQAERSGWEAALKEYSAPSEEPESEIAAAEAKAAEEKELEATGDGSRARLARVAAATFSTGTLERADALQRALGAAREIAASLKRGREKIVDDFHAHAQRKYAEEKTPRKLIRGILGGA